MGFERNIRRLAVAIALLGASCAAAAQPERLIVTQLPDPDPDYVPPPPESKGNARQNGDADENATIDHAMEDFGRAIGQAGLVIRQKAEARCREGIPADLSAEQRFAYEASCRYQRY
jgi:hypothetical protein